MIDIGDNALVGARTSQAGDMKVARRHLGDQALELLVISQHQATLHIDRNPLKGPLIIANSIACHLVGPRRMGRLE
ncbi:hypothetical protein RsS62_45710 [Rhizobium dioscoreae]|nr:hypothetical protein RsS62_45710 [Rhizobium dioscoreae]